MIKLTFKGEPKAVQSMRVARMGNFIRKYQPKKVVEWKNYIKLLAQQQYTGAPIDGAVRIIFIRFVFSPLKSFSKKKLELLRNGGKIYKITTPDLTDNLSKGLIDALSGIVWTDDSRICSVGGSEKVYGFEPCIEMEVEEINEIEAPGDSLL